MASLVPVRALEAVVLRIVGLLWPPRISSRSRWRAIYRGNRNHRRCLGRAQPSHCLPSHPRSVARNSSLLRKLRASITSRNRSPMSSSTTPIRLVHLNRSVRRPNSANPAYLCFRVDELALALYRTAQPRTLAGRSYQANRVTSSLVVASRLRTQYHEPRMSPSSTHDSLRTMLKQT